MAVMSTAGSFSFCSSASGIRHRTARVSGFTPGGRGVGTPGLIGSLLEVLLVGVARDLFASEPGKADWGAGVVSGWV